MEIIINVHVFFHFMLRYISCVSRHIYVQRLFDLLNTLVRNVNLHHVSYRRFYSSARKIINVEFFFIKNL